MKINMHEFVGELECIYIYIYIYIDALVGVIFSKIDKQTFAKKFESH